MCCDRSQGKLFQRPKYKYIWRIEVPRRTSIRLLFVPQRDDKSFTPWSVSVVRLTHTHIQTHTLTYTHTHTHIRLRYRLDSRWPYLDHRMPPTSSAPWIKDLYSFRKLQWHNKLGDFSGHIFGFVLCVCVCVCEYWRERERERERERQTEKQRETHKVNWHAVNSLFLPEQKDHVFISGVFYFSGNQRMHH